MLEIIGLLGGFCFAYAGVPAAIATIRKGASIGTPVLIAWAIFIGTLLMYTYLFGKFGLDWIVSINYFIEAVSWGVILKYHYFPKI
jgi:hypothetical protein